MQMILDALWRALADCLRAKVIAWSLFPLLLLGLFAALLGFFWWDTAVLAVQGWLERASWLQWLWSWMGTSTAMASAVAAGVLVVLMASPILIMVALAIVAVVMTPTMVELVAQRRFQLLERKRGGGVVSSALWALSTTAIALVALVLSAPLWLVPPMIVVLPPLIGGWLTYRVMTFDALAEHASKPERQTILDMHRYRLILMGVVCGYAGAAPSIVWASGVVFAAAFWVLIPLAIWIYAVVLAFSSLWFAHYALTALYQLRAQAGGGEATSAPSSSGHR
ncbi:MAG TPA: EI24 domain-containing protein [Comamonas sp.]